MTEPTFAERAKLDFVVGRQCLMTILRTHVMVELRGVDSDSLTVTFPGRDYPIEEIPVTIEFYDAQGFTAYETVVVKGPEEAGGTIVLQRPSNLLRTTHRSSCRVETDLVFQVRDQVHVRKYQAEAINMSAGGVLLKLDAPFEFGDTIQIEISIPGAIPQEVVGQIVHASGSKDQSEERFFGIRFLGLDEPIASAVAEYLWERMREQFAS